MSAPGVTYPRIARSEWIKLRSLRSPVLTVLLAGLAMVAVAVIGATNIAYDWQHGTAAERAALTPAQSLLSGWFLAQLLVGIVGVLGVTSEYASGSIASTLAAAPRRVPILLGKLLVPSAVAFAAMLPACVLGVLAGGPLLPAQLSVSLAEPGVPRAIASVSVALAVICAIGTAIGFLVRSSAGAIGILAVGLVVLPAFVVPLAAGAYRWLPSGAIESFVTIDRSASELPLHPWPVGLLVLCGYLALTVGAALVTLRRRDA